MSRNLLVMSQDGPGGRSGLGWPGRPGVAWADPGGWDGWDGGMLRNLTVTQNHRVLRELFPDLPPEAASYAACGALRQSQGS